MLNIPSRFIACDTWSTATRVRQTRCGDATTVGEPRARRARRAAMTESTPREEPDVTQLPLEERLGHKVASCGLCVLMQQWKARLSAYEELATAFAKADGSARDEYVRRGDVLYAMVTDANAIAQEKGIEAVSVFVTQGGTAAGQYVGDGAELTQNARGCASRRI